MQAAWLRSHAHFLLVVLSAATACARPPVLSEIQGALGLGLAHKAGVPRALGLPARGFVARAGYGPEADAAHVEIRFGTASGRKLQSLSNAYYEIRAMYTEAVVRSGATLADYHVGVAALPGSLAGYTLNLPPSGTPSGTPAGAGPPRLRYARHPVLDDPGFPSLADATRMLNPVADPGVYFLGRGVLETRHDAAFPPPVLDAFSAAVPSRAIGSASDVPSAKIPFAAAEALFNTIWNTGVSYTDGTGTHPLAPVVQDVPLADDTRPITSRYYKWKIPYAATTFSLGSGLPLGRLVVDIRVIDSAGRAAHSGASQTLLQPGANAMAIMVNPDRQDLVMNVTVTLAASGTGGSGTGSGTGTGATPTPAPPAAPSPEPSSDPTTQPTAAPESSPEPTASPTSPPEYPPMTSGVSTFAGSGAPGSQSGSWWSAQLNGPGGLAFNSAGDLVVSDSEGHLLRTVAATTGTVSAFAGDGASGLVNGPAAFARFSRPRGVARDALGNIVVADYDNHVIRRISPSGAVTTVAGDGLPGYNEGPAASARFNYPVDVAVDSTGAIYVADEGNHRIRKISPSGTVSSAAGNGSAGLDNGPANSSRFNGPSGLAIDPAGTIYVSDTLNHCIRKIQLGQVTTMAGSVSTFAGSGFPGFLDGLGTAAAFDHPMGLVADVSGDLFVSDTGNHAIRKVTASGLVSTVAGTGVAGFTEGDPLSSQFSSPLDVALDTLGRIYVSDYGNNRIRVISP